MQTPGIPKTDSVQVLPIASIMREASMDFGSNFDQDAQGIPPMGWSCGRTGSGSPRWQVVADASAPSKPDVLKQSGTAAFAWAMSP